MLPLGAHVIVDNHLHVQSIIPFLLESLFELEVLVVLGLGDLFDDLSLYFLDEFLALHDLLDRLLVLIHFAQDCSLVQVRGDDVVLLFVRLLV